MGPMRSTRDLNGSLVCEQDAFFSLHLNVVFTPWFISIRRLQAAAAMVLRIDERANQLGLTMISVPHMNLLPAPLLDTVEPTCVVKRGWSALALTC